KVDHAVFHADEVAHGGILALAVEERVPAVEVLAIKERDPTIALLGCGIREADQHKKHRTTRDYGKLLVAAHHRLAHGGWDLSPQKEPIIRTRKWPDKHLPLFPVAACCADSLFGMVQTRVTVRETLTRRASEGWSFPRWRVGFAW